MTVQQLRDNLAGLPGDATINALTGRVVELLPNEGQEKGKQVWLYADVPSALDAAGRVGVGNILL